MPPKPIEQVVSVFGYSLYEKFLGNEDDARKALEKYGSHNLSVERVFVYGILRRWGKPTAEAFNAIVAMQKGKVAGPVAISYRKVLYAQNIEITYGGVNRMSYAPGKTGLPSLGETIELFEIIGTRDDIDRFMKDWDNTEISNNYDKIVCSVTIGPPKIAKHAECFAYFDSDSPKPKSKSDVIIAASHQPHDWFILSSVPLQNALEKITAEHKIAQSTAHIPTLGTLEESEHFKEPHVRTSENMSEQFNEPPPPPSQGTDAPHKSDAGPMIFLKRLKDVEGNPIPNAKVIIHTDAGKFEAVSDANGYVKARIKGSRIVSIDVYTPRGWMKLEE